MDQNKFRNAEIISAAATVAASFLFHFLYMWTQNGFIALFSAVNESIWEHVKIVFFPYLIAAGIEYMALKPNLRRYLTAKAAGLIFIPLAMISFYYTYSGILGFRLTAVDISCAALWSVLAFLLSHKLYFSKMNIEKMPYGSQRSAPLSCLRSLYSPIIRRISLCFAMGLPGSSASDKTAYFIYTLP